MTNTNNLRAAGMNDEQTTCDACGRVELRGTVVVVDTVEGVEVGRYGTVCAGKILGRRISRSDAQRAESCRRERVAGILRDARREETAAGIADRLRDLVYGGFPLLRPVEIRVHAEQLARIEAMDARYLAVAAGGRHSDVA